MKTLLLLSALCIPSVFFTQTNAWSTVTLTGAPGNRDSHNMVWDSQNQRVILYGGHAGSPNPSWVETWAYNYALNSWTNMNPPTNPGYRDEYGLCYVSQHNCVILFNLDTAVAGSSTWSYNFNTNTWTDMNPSVAPVFVQFNGVTRIAYDSQSDRVIYVDYTTGKVWAYNYLANIWTDMNPPNPKPGTDWRPITVISYDSNHDRVIMATPNNQQTWAYDYNTNSWQQKGTAPNVVLTGGGLYDLDYDASSDKMLMYGDNQITWGYDYLTDLWTNMNPLPSGPPAHHHANCYITQTCKILFYGGIVGDNNNMWEYRFNPCLTGLPDAQNNNSFAIKIFPNPFSSVATLSTDIPLNNATLSFYNLFGQQVKQIKNISGQTILLKSDNLQSGVYFIYLTENDKTIIIDKLVIAD